MHTCVAQFSDSCHFLFVRRRPRMTSLTHLQSCCTSLRNSGTTMTFLRVTPAWRQKIFEKKLRLVAHWEEMKEKLTSSRKKREKSFWSWRWLFEDAKKARWVWELSPTCFFRRACLASSSFRSNDRRHAQFRVRTPFKSDTSASSSLISLARSINCFPPSSE